MGEKKRRAQATVGKREFRQVLLADNDSIPVLTGKLEPELLSAFKSEIARQHGDGPTPFNQGLAGAIKEEYLYDTSRSPQLVSYIEEMYDTYSRYFNLYQDKIGCLSQLWVNFQRKHEFNPLHNHTGAVSFVCWVGIPYDIDAEMAISSSGTCNVTSNFQFVYPGKTERIAMHNFPVATEWEGTVLMWPSWMLHCVYPFYTSDGFRITVAGNIFVLGENYKTNPNDDPDEYIRQSLRAIDAGGYT